MTFAQSYMFDALQPEPESLVPRVPFSARQKKEFGKTAQIIGLPPWLLHDATGYLLKLLQDNEDGHDSSWKPPKMSRGFYGAPHVEGPAVATSSIPSAALQFANRDPARVRVKMMAKKTLKAPADFARGAVAETGPPLPGSGDEEPGLPDASDNMAETPDLPDAPSVATEELAAEGSELELPDEPSRPPPRVNPGAGAPSCVRGRNGAPAGVYNSEAHEPEAPVMRRPAALKRPAAAPKPAGQKKAYRRLSQLPFPEGALDVLQQIKEAGHNKRRTSAYGCNECRRKAGLKLNDDESAWIWDPSRPRWGS